MSSLTELREALESAREKLAQQSAVIQELVSAPYNVGSLIALTEEESNGGNRKLATVMQGSDLLEVPINPMIEEDVDDWVGLSIRLSPKTGALIGLSGDMGVGSIALVSRVMENGTCELDREGDTSVVRIKGGVDVKSGDRVRLDRSGLVIVESIEGGKSRYSFTQKVNVPWSVIGGLEEAISILKEAIIMPSQETRLFGHYNKKPIKGVLLEGPPGTGKTLLAKAVATAFGEIYSADAGGFIYIKGPELLSMWVGQTEAAIRGIFAAASSFKQQHGYPAIIFIDEADAILGERGTRPGNSTINTTVVPQFLSEMDGIGESGATVLLATNKPGVLDPAIVRDGRIDRTVRIDRPNVIDSEKILGIHMKDLPIHDAPTYEDLCKSTAESVFSEESTFLNLVLEDGTREKFGLQHIVSGAMLAGIVDKATSLAIHRDKADGTLTGVSPEDMNLAIFQTRRSQRNLNHNEAIIDLGHGFGKEIVGVEKI